MIDVLSFLWIKRDKDATHEITINFTAEVLLMTIQISNVDECTIGGSLHLRLHELGKSKTYAIGKQSTSYFYDKRAKCDARQRDAGFSVEPVGQGSLRKRDAHHCIS